MAKKNKSDKDALVYSTSKDTMAGLFAGLSVTNDDSLEMAKAKDDVVRVWIDRKRRGGKAAVIIKGIKGTNLQLTELAKFLKSKCGVGGAAKDGEIIIQGSQRDKVIKLLQEKGYTDVKAAGGG